MKKTEQTEKTSDEESERDTARSKTSNRPRAPNPVEPPRALAESELERRGLRSQGAVESDDLRRRLDLEGSAIARPNPIASDEARRIWSGEPAVSQGVVKTAYVEKIHAAAPPSPAEKAGKLTDVPPDPTPSRKPSAGPSISSAASPGPPLPEGEVADLREAESEEAPRPDESDPRPKKEDAGQDSDKEGAA